MFQKRSGFCTAGQNSKPLLIDKFCRSITYLRLSVTDRCNLRCRYCMPSEGITFQPEKNILSWQEMIRLTKIFINLGIKKLRLTGGEPFTRKGILDFLSEIRSFHGLEKIYITTNGVGIAQFIPSLKAIGIDGINLSLDTLNNQRFVELTGRDCLDQVLKSFFEILKYNIPLKTNTVVTEGFNTSEIFSIARLCQNHPVEVRFIEEMPFLGQQTSHSSTWDSDRIISELQSGFSELIHRQNKNSTARSFVIPGFAGSIGVIAGNSRSFCSECNRIRVTANGKMKTCLYGDGTLDLRSMLRSEGDDEKICYAINKCVENRNLDGFEAYEKRKFRTTESMAEIGG